MVGDVGWDMRSITRCLNQPPSVVTLHWVTARSVHLFVVQFTEALKIQLVQRIETAFANIKAAKNEELLLKDEA